MHCILGRPRLLFSGIIPIMHVFTSLHLLFLLACPMKAINLFISHSVETAIVCIQDDVLRSLDARKHVALVLLDLSAAFDTIDHCILLDELHRIGVRGDALRWMSSYLTDRTQCVSVDDHLSCEIRLQHGVPQGSVLAPSFYLYTVLACRKFS